ncbi:MAG: signal peptide peptidase SppA [Candidatus Margulisbacteria bacterium]|nr:signal peptide peptidase SppA [Candidatus Margulisiibacteriota bacterium]
MKRVFFVGVLIALFSHVVMAEGVGETALKNGIGARWAGMGSVGAAIANDASAIFYNPANLAEFGFGFSLGSLDSQQLLGEQSFRLVKLAYLGYADGKVVDPTGDSINFSALGFGNRSGWLNWGANFKNQEWTVGGTSQNGWTADLGVLARITPQFKIGVAAQDVLTSKNRIVPASLRVGFGYKPLDGQLLIAGDAELYRSQPASGHFGVELNLVQGLALRGGIDGADPTAGATLDLGVFSLDYAVQFPSNGKNIQKYEAGLKWTAERLRPFSLIKPKEFALIDIAGAIKGGQAEYSFLGGFRPGLDDILAKIRASGRDPSIDGIILRLSGFDGGLGGAAVVQEMREEIGRAKAKGKKVIAYVEGSAVGDEYYLASAADKIVAAPGSGIGGFGRSIAIYRFPETFKKLGIEWQVLTKGKYKSSFDWLSPAAGKEQKAMLEGVVADVYRQMLTDIAASRKKKIEKVKESGDGMIFPSGLAKKMGLVDQVGYFRDVCSVATKLCGETGEAKIVEPQLLEPEEVFFAQVFGVAVVEVDGEMVSGDGGQNLIFGGTYTGSDKIVSDIRAASDDIFVKAIVLRIDSPGGSPVAAGEIYRALQYAKEKKKVVIASMGGVAASAGYYIAAGADKIVADRSTITGSIGVIGAYPLFAELMKKIGATADVIKEGKHADMFSGLRKMTSVEVMAMDRLMEESYRDFINAVATGRQIATKEVERMAQGRVYTGAQAFDVKLVDKLGGFADAVDLAKTEGKIMGEPRLIYYRAANPFLQAGAGISSFLGLPPLTLPNIGSLRGNTSPIFP